MSDEDPRVVWQRACEALGELPETVSFEDAGDACMRAARELLALSRRLAGVACDACRGLGDRIYPTTATWNGGAGGAAPTLGVCDRCWRSGRHDQRGPDLREAARVSDALRQETRLSLAMTEQRDEARAERDELLAIIHRDGGHYVGEHGLTKAVADAHATWAAMVLERDAAIAERDDAKAESVRARVGYDEACVFPRGFSVCVVTRNGQVIVRVSLHDSARAETMPLEPHEARQVASLLRNATECDHLPHRSFDEALEAARAERDALRARFVELHDEVVLEASLDRKGRAYTSACVREWCAARIEATLKEEEEQ